MFTYTQQLVPQHHCGIYAPLTLHRFAWDEWNSSSSPIKTPSKSGKYVTHELLTKFNAVQCIIPSSKSDQFGTVECCVHQRVKLRTKVNRCFYQNQLPCGIL